MTGRFLLCDIPPMYVGWISQQGIDLFVVGKVVNWIGISIGYDELVGVDVRNPRSVFSLQRLQAFEDEVVLTYDMQHGLVLFVSSPSADWEEIGIIPDGDIDKSSRMITIEDVLRRCLG